MDIFGDNWKGHEEKIKKDWIEKVTDNDLPDYKKHGPAAWERVIDAPIVKKAENVVFNNTTFTAD